VNPWDGAIKRALPGKVQAISTNTICDLLDVPPTTANAREIAKSMRALGFVPIKSRRLVRGGFRNTTIRGWARPERTASAIIRPVPQAPTGASDIIRS
jgi:hypothetical protein